MDILLKRGVSGPTLYKWAAELDAKKRNKVLVPFFIKHTTTHAELTKDVTAEMIASLLDSMRGVFDTVGLLYLVSLDDLRKDKWTLSDKPKKVDKEPVVKRKKGAAGKVKRVAPASAAPVGRPKKPLKDRMIKAIALAMSSMTWLQLSDMYGPNKGLAKSIFNVMHINAVLLKRQKSIAKAPASKETEAALRGAKLALLAVLCLRGCRYPATAEGWPQYVEQVQRPLVELDATNPLVKVDGRFLKPAYDASQAGLKLKVPHSRTVDAVLSQDGNSVATWDHLLNTRGTTAANVFSHWRSLVLLAYDPEKLFAFLEKRVDGMDLFKLMGVRQMLVASFEPGVFATVREALDEAKGKPADVHPRAEGGKVARVVLGERTFQDKQGKSSKQVITRSVAAVFGPDTFQTHLRVCDRLCALKMQPSKPAAGTAVLFVTNELLNGLRKGTPPSIPAYSQVALWRNEATCLSELAEFGAPPISRVRAGITWCQKKGQGDVDLDLSVTLFSDQWVELGSCSYSNTKLASCITHSGDVRGAPWPDGGREAIDINFDQLKKDFPTCRFIALQVRLLLLGPHSLSCRSLFFCCRCTRTVGRPTKISLTARCFWPTPLARAPGPDPSPSSLRHASLEQEPPTLPVSYISMSMGAPTFTAWIRRSTPSHARRTAARDWWARCARQCMRTASQPRPRRCVVSMWAASARPCCASARWWCTPTPRTSTKWRSLRWLPVPMRSTASWPSIRLRWRTPRRTRTNCPPSCWSRCWRASPR
jgi:hypothetical protein